MKPEATRMRRPTRIRRPVAATSAAPDPEALANELADTFWHLAVCMRQRGPEMVRTILGEPSAAALAPVLPHLVRNFSGMVANLQARTPAAVDDGSLNAAHMVGHMALRSIRPTDAGKQNRR